MPIVLIVLVLSLDLAGCGAARPESEEPLFDEAEAREISEAALVDHEDLVQAEEVEYAADPRLRATLILPRTVDAYPRGGVTEWYDPRDPDAGFIVRVRVRNASDEDVSVSGPQILVVIRDLRASNCQPSRGGLMPTGPDTLSAGASHTFSYRVQCRDMRSVGTRSFQAFIHFNQPADYEFPHPDTFRAEHAAGRGTVEVTEPSAEQAGAAATEATGEMGD